MLIQAIPFGIAQNIQPLFIPHVVSEFGFTLSGFSLIFTIGALASSIASPILGKLFDKIGIKTIFILGTLVSSFGFFMFSQCNTLYEFYFWNAVCQIGCIFFSALGVPYLIQHWFTREKRGRALGIAFAGGSIGNIFLQQITEFLLSSYGSSITYAIFGIISAAFSIPVILFFIRMPKSEEIEIEKNEVNDKDKPIHHQEFEGLGVSKNTKSPVFWIFGLGYAIVGISISALSTQYATYFTNGLNLSPELVGILGSLFAAFCLFGNIGGGVLFDKLGTLKTMRLSMILQVSAILALLLATKLNALAFIYSIAYGLNVFSYMSAPAIMSIDLFGKKDSSVILGFIQLFFAVGFAGGSTLFGLIVDKTGGFNIAWIAMLACAVSGYILLLIGIKKLKKKKMKLINIA
jgi:MFS family permease